jgi:uncharacterized membrane protein
MSNPTQPAQTNTPNDAGDVSKYGFGVISLVFAIMALVVAILQLRVEYRRRKQWYADVDNGSETRPGWKEGV